MHAQFRKGRSGNPGGRPRRTASERAKALALREAYRTITVKEGGRALAVPAIQAILRSQIALAAKGNVLAQRAVLAAIQTIEQENVVAERAARRSRQAQRAAFAAIHTIGQENSQAAALAAQNVCENMSYTEAARRVMSLLRLDEAELKLKSEQDNSSAGAAQSETGEAPRVAPRAPYVDARAAMMPAAAWDRGEFFSPPPCGEGSGVGSANGALVFLNLPTPHPGPPPQRGGRRGVLGQASSLFGWRISLFGAKKFPVPRRTGNPP